MGKKAVFLGVLLSFAMLGSSVAAFGGTGAGRDDVDVDMSPREISLHQEIAKVSRELPEDFSYSSVDNDRGVVTLAFKDAAPAVVKSLLEEFPDLLEVKTHTGYSRADLLSQAEAAYDEATGTHGLQTDELLLSIRPDKGLVNIDVNRSAKALQDKSSSLVNILSNVGEVRATKNSPIKIKYALSPDTTMHDEALYGGGRISYDARDKGIGTCTTAFAAENEYYPHALFTAGHCLKHGATVYGKWDSGIFLDKIIIYEEHDGDVGVVAPSLGAVTESKFWSEKEGGLTPVTWRIDNPIYGQWLAVKGELSGRQYSSVQGDVCFRDSGRRLDCNYVYMNTHVTQGGDSGGPWFSSGGAAGIHKGLVYVDGQARSCFTKIAKAESVSGFKLKMG